MNEKANQLEQDICAASQGDGDAYGRIVILFQDMAFFTALRYLGDRQDAEDAAQNAFIEAYRCLHALREPLAFPAWFKRIVFKQCDRISRKRQPLLLDEAAWRLFGDANDTPERLVSHLQQREAIRRYVHTLPPLYRDVATLFYFNGRSTNDIAVQLDLSVSTVKKRLFTARQHLKEMLEPMSTLKKPSQDASFTNRVRFFIALQNDELTQLRQLLRRDPSLLTTRTEWNKGAASWYMPLGTTAIHLAAGNGNLPMLKLLLEEGAEIDLPDHAGRSAFYHAAHMGHTDLVRWLLEEGANPDAAAHNGHTPLHAAVIRNHASIVELLLAHGVDTAALDSQERSPLDWAIEKGLTNIAMLINSDAECDPPSRATITQTTRIWETGIKILDLVAPLKWGGKNGLLCPISGIGVDVMMGELIHRMATHHDGKTVQLGLSHNGFDADSRMMQWRNLGVAQHVELVFGDDKESESRRLYLVQRAANRARTLAAQQPVLLIVYTHVGLTDTMMDTLDNVVETGNVTLLFAGGETIGAEPPKLASLEAAFTFDFLRAGEGWWPALDMTRSFSNQYESDRHADVAQAAVRLARRYSDLHRIYKKQGLDGVDLALHGGRARTEVIRARRLHAYLNQPLVVVEPWSATPGQFVPLDETLSAVQSILDGAYDNIHEDEVTQIGAWSPRWT